MTHYGSVWPAWMWRPAISILFIAFHLSDFLPQLFLIFPLFAQVRSSSPRRHHTVLDIPGGSRRQMTSNADTGVFSVKPVFPLLAPEVAVVPLPFPARLAGDDAGRFIAVWPVILGHPWSTLVNLGQPWSGLGQTSLCVKRFSDLFDLFKSYLSLTHMWRKAYRQNMIFCWQI